MLNEPSASNIVSTSSSRCAIHDGPHFGFVFFHGLEEAEHHAGAVEVVAVVVNLKVDIAREIVSQKTQPDFEGDDLG